MDVIRNADFNSANSAHSPGLQPTPTKRRSIWPKLTLSLLLLLLLTLAVTAWLWTLWRENDDELRANQTQLAAAQLQITDLREQLGIKNDNQTGTQNLAVNDEQQIKAVTEDYNNALATPLAEAAVEVTKRDGVQAVAKVSGVTAGYNAYLKKVNGAWVVVWVGQDAPPSDVIRQFNLTV